MSDRFGPSENCPSCGQIQSYGHFEQCSWCEKIICEDCKSNHACKYEDIREKEEDDF